ncbi:hypothetical protein [Streptomyces reniochalinae]|uniref:Uncharacterized protein n=1 Tax=Streptomyces reniochalinae TaxID=2250578 RepID=A0A367EFD3_9ACTN|nr:hypothetical protein [Streptomyces reniochalinae]RCG16764.1 hypothetical protein DQ392_21545 [Streptomyces reniochalinae]
MSSVLVLGFDPHAVPDTDAEALQSALDAELARFADHALDASVALLPVDASAVSVAVAALTERKWDVVVIGGGIRKPEPALLFFEQVVNLVREHAPGAALAFNSGIGDTFEAARRRLPAAP